MSINMELSFFQLRMAWVALEAINFEQRRGKGNVAEELLKKELSIFLMEQQNILGAESTRRKNIQDILDYLGSKKNLEKDSREHRLIREVLIELLKN